MKVRFSIAATFAAALCMGLAAVASASAHEFTATVENAKLTATALNTQVFEAGGAEGLKVKCTSLEVTKGVAEGTKNVHQKATIEYKGCEESAGNLEVKPITAEYEFSAEGTVSVLKEITISTTVAGECTIKVPVQSALGIITYVNSGKGIEIKAAVTKIKSSGSGNKQTACNYTEKASEEAHEKEGGKYKGNALVEEVGGELKWV